mmetsp:Transcript_10340/g.24889  ORF Transcript_10340/g.24889 Transcript_10340/m.24889 type:complete len:82 (+) Transcript_10340:353-598(+)|eukprot:s1319_g5.t1
MDFPENLDSICKLWDTMFMMRVTMLRSMVARMKHAPEKAECDFQALQGLRHEAAQCEKAKVVAARAPPTPPGSSVQNITRN